MMAARWKFFTAVRATRTTCHTAWQWRRIDDNGCAESAGFKSIAECVADARLHGYTGPAFPASVAWHVFGDAHAVGDELPMS